VLLNIALVNFLLDELCW